MSLSAMFTSIKVTKVTKKLTHINNFIHSYMFFFFFMNDPTKREELWVSLMREKNGTGLRKKKKKKKKKQRSCVTGPWVSK